MPHSASAKKRNRQNIRNRERNRAAKSVLKTEVRKVLEAIGSGDMEQARDALKTVARTADKAAAARTIHRNKAARIKSRLSARMVAASKGGTAAGKTASKGRQAAGAGRKT